MYTCKLCKCSVQCQICTAVFIIHRSLPCGGDHDYLHYMESIVENNLYIYEHTYIHDYVCIYVMICSVIGIYDLIM